MNNKNNGKVSKQTTLFQSWGSRKKECESEGNQSTWSTGNTFKAHAGTDIGAGEAVIDLCDSFDDDADEFLYNAEESTCFDTTSVDGGIGETGTNKVYTDQNVQLDRRSVSLQQGVSKYNDDVGDISIGADCVTPTQGQTQAVRSNLPGFDLCAGKLWIYPTNYPVRDYQYNIVQQALFKNTLVTLPTGLGKTFIGAVLMYNFYRWYPQGKVIFMAPTKPLVAQQIEACYSIMGIPQDHTAEMTGSMGPPKRERAWQEKRVFFLTPQVLTNDLSRGSCPATELKCLVVDEAHKALGNHAYCQVVRELVKYTENFRVLALSATPGSDIKAVQQVLSNLLISHIELRTEESIDISQYTHERKVEKIVIPLGDELTKVRVVYIHIMDVVVARLKNHNVLYNRETTSLSKFLILKAREAFRQNPPEQLQRSLYGVVEGDFALAMSLYHGFELLQLHGLRSLYNFLDGILTGNKGHGRTRSELTRNADFNQLMAMLTEKYGETLSQKSGMASSRAVVLGHPKMAKLQEIVVRHFNEFDKKGGTRVMIFSQYRDSVQEITDMLNAHRPLVKVMNFIGQSSAGKAAKGFTQKEQLKVMKLFREGGYNTLVSTCVGEEGLDIGDVDLIICFDAHKSPIRLVQRMGRTGRKRKGRIVMLVTQGKEEQIYNQSQYSKRSIHKAILNGARSLHFYQNSPRMLPEGCNPVPHKMFITLKESFKPTRKVDSEGSSRQGKITSFASDKDGVPDVLLTSEEYRELSEWQVPEAEVPQVPTTELVSLQKPHEMNETTDRVATTKVMSLGDWSPWQNTLQPTDQVDHSMASRHLVELMEFIQLQQSLDPGDDPYGLEMAAYLNDEDVLKPGETEDTPGSIRKFCVPCDSTSADPSKPNPGKGKRKLLKKKPRLSDQLPNFQCESSKAGSSDDELPAFNLRTNETNKDTDMETVLTVGQSTDKESVNNASEMNTIPCDFRDKLKKSTHVDVSGIGDVVFVRKSVVKKQFSSLSNAKKCVTSSAKSMEKKMAEGKSRKRKRSRQSSRPSAVVEVIADTDANDFDQLQPSFCNIVVKEPSAEMNRNEVVDLTCKVLTNDVEPYSNNSISEPTDIGDKDDRQYVIRTPPTIHDAIVVCETEGEATGLAKLDLEKLVKEWEMENNNGKYIVYPKSSDEKRISKTLKTVNDTMNDNQAFLPEIQVDAISDINILHNVSTSEQTKDACDVKISVVKEVSTSLCDLNVSGLNAPSLTHSAIKRNSDTLNVFDESPKGDKCNGSITLTARELLPSYKIQTSVHSVQATIETNTSCLLNVEELKKMNDSFFDTDIYSISASDGDIMFKTSELSASKQTDRAENVSNDKEAKSIGPVSPDECVQPADKDDKQSLSNKRTNHRALCEFQDVVESSPVPFTTKPSAIVNHNDFDSWLLDDTSDELMLAVNTPAKNNLNYSNTQVTFTQALASVHSCSSVESDEIPFHKQNTQPFHVVEPVNVSKPECGLECVIGVEKVHAGENKTCDNNLKTALGGWKEHSNNSSNKYMKDEKTEKLGNKVCHALDNSIDTEVCTESGKSSPELISEYSMHRIQEPSEEQVNKPDIDFDLGFDLDDEIVPPSPNATQKSGISRLSQAFATSINQFKSLAEDDKHEIAVNERCSRENDSSTHVKMVFGKSLLGRSKRSRKLFNKCDSSARNHSETAGSGQSIVGNILNENSNELKTIKTLLPVVQEQEASYSLINDNDVFEEIAHTDIDKSDPVQFTSQNDQVKCLDKIDYTSKKGIELTKSNNSENSASESMKNYIVTSPKFDSSFALLDDDLDDWINSGNEISNANEKSEDNQMSGNSNSTFTFGSLSRSKKQLKTPVARVRPLTDDNQDMSGKDEPESTANVAGNKKIATLKAARSESFNNSKINAACMITPKLSQGRKSEFLIDDFSPDCFDDSFNMDLESKAATSLCAKRRFSANTSTPVHVPESKIKEITPQRQNEPASPLPKLNTSNVSYKSSPDLGLDNDESFVVRRKKKVCIISSPFTEDVNNECDMSSKYTTDMVNLTIPTKESDIKHSVKDHVKIKKKRIPVTLFSSDEDDFDDSVLLSKKQFGKGKHAAIHDSSDDFNEPETNTKVNTDINSKKLNIQKGTFMDKGHGNKLIDNQYTNAKKNKRNRASNPFLCEEAELSEEDAENVSDDEEEHSDLDVYEDSFIHDSQFAQSQACSQTDMQAVYMKSVKSPNVGRGKYKLQYDYKHVDVFSQVPQNEHSHYMEDSFCVGEEGDDWLGGLAEDEEEITVYQPESTVLHTGRKKRRAVGKYLETGRQREIQAGRMRALDEIKSRLAGNNNKRKQVIAKPVILSSTSSDDEVSEKAPKRSRIRMLLDDSSSEEDTDIHIINKSHIKSTANQLSCNVKTRKAKIFSSSDDDDASDFMQKGNRSKVLARSRSGNIDVVNQQSNHADLDKIRVSKANEIGPETVNAESLKFSQEIRQDRLQRQQLKQEQYRRNMANSNKAVNIPGNASANQSSNSGLRTFDKDHSLTKVKPKMSISQKISNDNNDKALDIMSVTRQSALLETGLLQSDTSKHTPPSGKLVVLVDSKEISGSQDIVSDLRFKHNVQVSVAQLPGCDYILSNRMAVERKQWSEFSNGANRAKLVERMQHLADLYDRSSLIVENDRVKPGEERSTKPKHWTKYVDRTIAMLLRSDIKVLFTDNQSETAALIADLCHLEQRKGMAITVPVDLSAQKQSAIKFYVSIPKLSYVHALNLCSGFVSVSQFMKSSVSVIQKKGQMSESRAFDVHDYLRRTFDSNMLPSALERY